MSTDLSPEWLLDTVFARWRAAATFLVIGFLAIIAGGLVAAVTGPAELADGSWVAAYLVLVVGVAQLALGGGQAWLCTEPPTRTRRVWQLATYNLGNALVVVGTLTDTVPAVQGGGALLVVALVLFLVTTHGAGAPRWLILGYRLIVAILAVSIPIGLTLSALRR